jgi:phage shock protein A
VQSNLFERFSRVVKSNVDSLIQNVEDPEKIIDQAVAEMQSDVVKTKQEVAKYMATLKQTEARYNAQADESSQWMKRAELALSKGDEELAREALKRKKTAEELATNYKIQLDNAKSAVDQLVANARTLEQKVADAKAKKTTLKARAATARSSKQIQDLVSGLDEKSALGAFDRMEEKVLGLEAENEAVAQLKAPEKDIMDKFAELESGDSVEDELTALKGKMLGKPKEVKASLPEGRPVKDAIDAELDALRKKTQDI